MDDRASLKKVSGSTESVATVTSEEFVLVQSNAGSPQSSEGRPRLKMSCNGDEQLEKAMEEVLGDEDDEEEVKEEKSSTEKMEKHEEPKNHNLGPTAPGKSSSHSAVEVPPMLSLFCFLLVKCETPGQRSSLSSSRPEEDSVQFNKLCYLGCTWVKAPRNEAEAQRAMATLRAESAIPIPIILHVPCGPNGSVRIVEQSSGTEIASFPIYKVLFCARGKEGTVESDCFSFTESYRSSEDFQIHVFSCEIKEAVSRILYSFSTAFRRSSKPADSVDSAQSGPSESDLFCFTVTWTSKRTTARATSVKLTFQTPPINILNFLLGKKNMRRSSVPKDRDKFYFKLRQSVQKKVVVSVQQVTNKELGVESCDPHPCCKLSASSVRVQCEFDARRDLHDSARLVRECLKPMRPCT
ncbi:hypothetical protein WMY93_024157 [Mugilogobius chulae]|uniref:PID domain-containing protein n=1 Tax=Mugilogobius chulae TaxID=88201 RepID=A0AAW0N9X9_9GOBI